MPRLPDERPRYEVERAALSPREIQVLRLSSEGKPYPVIARELNLAYEYVKGLGHCASCKLGADNITQAVAMAIRRGIIE